jgi:hypothetical protein
MIYFLTLRFITFFALFFLRPGVRTSNKEHRTFSLSDGYKMIEALLFIKQPESRRIKPRIRLTTEAKLGCLTPNPAWSDD